MKRIFFLAAVLCLALTITACGGGSGDGDGGSIGSAIENDPRNQTPAIPNPTDPGAQPGPEAPAVGVLGELIDLKDLLQSREILNPPRGEQWYYSRAKAINDNGVIVGQSNFGTIPRAAAMWEKETGAEGLETFPSQFLFIHGGGIQCEQDSFPRVIRYSEAISVNNQNEIIGNSTTGDGWPQEEPREKKAFYYFDGQTVDLHQVVSAYFSQFSDLVVCATEAVDINGQGEILFTVVADRYEGEEWREEVQFGLVLSGSLEAPEFLFPSQVFGAKAKAVALNETGHVFVNSGDTVVFTDLNWGVGEVLNHLPGARQTFGVAINDSRFLNHDSFADPHIIGNSGNGLNPNDINVAEDDVQGFFWDGGAMYPVGHLGGGSSVVADLNNNDQVVGSATLEDGSVHAFLWTLVDKKGVIADLGTLGGRNSHALAINEAGEVVGYSQTGEFYEEQGVRLPIWRAFVWKDGVMYDLGSHDDFYDHAFMPPFPFSEAVAINEHGEIAGNSLTINVHSRGFFLAPEYPAVEESAAP
ncbi:DUF3466 family protein [Geoalkalibacter halelectricus]|uniref:DUF3466 family protein n=1 Tax=Geoalkalibacter halelectricus TaxID=2847045 RepID=A0ABY5ZSM9_9BACT|nr:DUF3466 family protein [Geoalkalibacter halelectricus]MDO3378439.1 DUF3466 family protein [Geoalkalibacter halelectricus]UWZ80241.1 DUF3466 family protein [Geoalkalibacter halelectricus]